MDAALEACFDTRILLYKKAAGLFKPAAFYITLI